MFILTHRPPNRAFFLGVAIIMACFLAFALALGGTSNLSFGDSFSIAGYCLACASTLFALMALASYMGFEDINPGNPINNQAINQAILPTSSKEVA
jgi:hypothetical protein